MRSRFAFLSVLAAGVAVPHVVVAQAAKLRLGSGVADVYGEPYYVQAAGAFAKAGYDVEVQTIPGGAAQASALAGAAIDLGIADVVSAASAIVKGVPLQMIAGAGVYRSTEPWLIVAVAKDSPIRAPRDLEGRTIALPQLAGFGLAGTRAWLRQTGVDVTKVNTIEFRPSAVTAALGRGTFDAALMGEPYITPNRNEIRDIGHPLDAIAKEFLVTAWVAQRSWVEQDRDRARRVVAAIYETARWGNSHRSDTLAILAREGKLDIEQVHGMVRATYATALVPTMIQPVLDTATEFKLIDRPVDASMLITRL